VAPTANGQVEEDTPKRSTGKKAESSVVLNLKRSKTGQTLTLKHSAGTSNKSARAYKKTYSSGPPLVPAYVFDRVMAYTSKVKMAKKPAFISMVCRYWSLKREARRGAPLLKRLHLEVRSSRFPFLSVSLTG